MTWQVFVLSRSGKTTKLCNLNELQVSAQIQLPIKTYLVWGTKDQNYKGCKPLAKQSHVESLQTSWCSLARSSKLLAFKALHSKIHRGGVYLYTQKEPPKKPKL